MRGQRGRGLRAHGCVAAEADGRRAGPHPGGRSRHPDHGLPGAEDLQSRNRDRGSAVRSASFPRFWPGTSTPGSIIHEGQLTYTIKRAVQGHRPGHLVARDHRPGAAAGRQRDPAVAGRRGRTRSSPKRCATRSGTRSITANRRWNMRCSLRATWTPRWPAAL